MAPNLIFNNFWKMVLFFFVFICLCINGYLLLLYFSRFIAPIRLPIIPFLGKSKGSIQVLEGRFRNLCLFAVQDAHVRQLNEHLKREKRNEEFSLFFPVFLFNSSVLLHSQVQILIFSYGSAFMIGDGKLLTNAHCVEHYTQVIYLALQLVTDILCL